MPGSDLIIQLPDSNRDHNKLINKNANKQHRLESIYRELDGKNLSDILNEIGGNLIRLDYNLAAPQITSVSTDINFPSKGIIKGIKVFGPEVGEFTFSIKTLSDNWIYQSGTVQTILWDIMDIPHLDIAQQVHIILNNLGIANEFQIQIFIIV